MRARWVEAMTRHEALKELANPDSLQALLASYYLASLAVQESAILRTAADFSKPCEEPRKEA